MKIYALEPICKAKGLTLEQCWYQSPITVILEIFLGFLFVREILECVTRGPKEYFSSKENFLQLFIYALTMTFICMAPVHMVMANHFLAWVVFWACINITQLVGRIGKRNFYFKISPLDGAHLKLCCFFSPMIDVSEMFGQCQN